LIVGAVQVIDVLGHGDALGIHPRAAADPVARVHGAIALGREVSPPGLAACAGGLGQLLTMRVGAGEAAEIGAFSRSVARNEEAHSRLLRRRGAHEGKRNRNR
jgi:hypothetical protein